MSRGSTNLTPVELGSCCGCRGRRHYARRVLREDNPPPEAGEVAPVPGARGAGAGRPARGPPRQLPGVGCLPGEPTGRSVVVHDTRGKSRLRPNHASRLHVRVGVTTAVDSLTGRDRWIGHPGPARPREVPNASFKTKTPGKTSPREVARDTHTRTDLANVVLRSDAYRRRRAHA